MSCPGPFHFSYSVHYIYDFCPLPDPDVGLSRAPAVSRFMGGAKVRKKIAKTDRVNDI